MTPRMPGEEKGREKIKSNLNILAYAKIIESVKKITAKYNLIACNICQNSYLSFLVKRVIIHNAFNFSCHGHKLVCKDIHLLKDIDRLLIRDSQEFSISGIFLYFWSSFWTLASSFTVYRNMQFIFFPPELIYFIYLLTFFIYGSVKIFSYINHVLEIFPYLVAICVCKWVTKKWTAISCKQKI